MREELRGEHFKGFVHGSSPLDTKTRGCLGGVGFCFISHVGQVSPCGYLELDCGNVSKNTFHDIWSHSRTLWSWRSKNEGNAVRKFVMICGGCQPERFISGNYPEKTLTARTTVKGGVGLDKSKWLII
jgi:MoaA/NifB/PqqE/SkfB family radical SAM enzyme